MLLPNRHGSTDSYRYGFQGQEKDDEIKGEGNSMNYKFRMHDPRVGRFFAVDPLTAKYPELTPYQFSSNKVIQYVELEGLEAGVRGGGSHTAAKLYMEGKITKEEYYGVNEIRGYGALAAIPLTIDLYTGANGLRFLGKVGTGAALGEFYQATLETEKGYEALERCDEVAAEKHFLKAGEYSKGMIFEALGGVGAYALGKLYQSGKALLQASSRGSDWIEFNLKIGEDIVPVGNSKLKSGTLEMDFNTAPAGDSGKGMGTEMLEETFMYWGDDIKNVDVTWGMDELYPNNTSKGLKDAWNYYDSMPNATPEAAVKSSRLYSILKGKGFEKIKVHSFERDMIEVTFEKSNK